MPVIDVQVHCYERNHPGRPWAGVLHGPPEVTGDDMVAAMDSVGVDGAILVSPYAMYRFDGSYAVEVRKAHPGRFAIVKPVDTKDPAVGEVIADWARIDGAVGIRIMMNADVSPDPADPGIARVLEGSAKHGLPVNLLCWGRLDQVEGMAARHPDTSIIIDHIGMPQTYVPPPPDNPWGAMPKLLALARYPNVSVKVSGGGTLARKPFPYEDIWDPIRRIIDTFGIDRCMWGTDWTRTISFLTYAQATDAFRVTDRLSDSDRAALMGGTLEKIYGWSPTRR